MPRNKHVVHADGTEEDIEMSEEEDDELLAAAESAQATLEARTTHESDVESVAPDETLAGKVRNGDSLSAGESAALLRWVALQLLGPEAP